MTGKEVLGKCKPKERSGKQKGGIAVLTADEVEFKVKSTLYDKTSIHRRYNNDYKS